MTRTRPEAVFEPGLVGHPLPQYRIEIRDEQDRPVQQGAVGEVVIGAATEGPMANVYTPMLGYWNKPDETARALRGGRYYSGDLGRLDGGGQLFIMGRAKEMVIRGGANVYPAEVERVLHDQPGVAAAAVVGVPDERLGERVVAFLQPAPGADRDAEALTTACKVRLARYKCPEEFVFVDSMPRNAMGKILKRELSSAIQG